MCAYDARKTYYRRGHSRTIPDMPSAVAEGQTAAMATAARPWRLNTASRLQRSPVYAGQSIIHAVVLYMQLPAA